MQKNHYKSVDELTFTDDGMFQAVMHKPEICAEVIVCLKDEDKVIDVECQDYSELKDSYILFICKYDPFKDSSNKPYALPCYTFKNMCTENPSVNLNDNTLKVFLIQMHMKMQKTKRFANFWNMCVLINRRKMINSPNTFQSL